MEHRKWRMLANTKWTFKLDSWPCLFAKRALFICQIELFLGFNHKSVGLGQKWMHTYANRPFRWNTETGECFKTLRGHSDAVSRLQQLESGELVSCSYDCTIKIWNITEGTCIRTLVGHTSSITSIRENRQSNTLASCSSGYLIKIWNLKTGDCINTIDVKNEGPGLEDFNFDLVFGLWTKKRKILILTFCLAHFFLLGKSYFLYNLTFKYFNFLILI